VTRFPLTDQELHCLVLAIHLITWPDRRLQITSTWFRPA